jgi:hypothetical protein
MDIEQLLAKKAERKVAAEERKKERADKGEVNKLVIERTEHGLYFARYSAGGQVPDSIKGLFTHKPKLLDAVQQHYGDTSVVAQ